MKYNIKCRVCKKLFGRKGFSSHLKRVHNIFFKEYSEKYFEDFPNLVKCPICNNITTGNTCSRKCYSEYKKTMIGSKSTRFGKKLSQESKDKISKSAKERLKDKRNHPRYKVKLSEETRKKISISQIKFYSDPNVDSPFKGRTHTPETIQKIFKHRKITQPEKIVKDILEKNKIKYYFQFFINDNGICKAYDFKLKGKDILIEVDGDYWHGGPGLNEYFFNVENVKKNDKLKDKIAKKYGYSVIHIWESEIKSNPNVILNKINNLESVSV